MMASLDKTREPLGNQAPFQMRVVAGNQRGAAAALPEGAILIGNTFEADVILTGTEVRPRHASVTLTDRGIDLEALDGAVSVNGIPASPGERLASRYPATVRIGESEIEFQRSQPRLVDLALAPKNRVIAIAAAGAGVVLIALLSAYAYLAETSPRPLLLRNAAFEEAKLKETTDVRARLEAASQTALAGLKTRLQADGLTDLAVSSQPGMVAVSGTVDNANRKAWSDIQRWYDETYGKTVALQSNIVFTARKAASAPVAVQSIWAGKMPYFIDAKGDKYFEGSMLRDGWSVEKIEEGKIMLVKGSEHLLLVL